MRKNKTTKTPEFSPVCSGFVASKNRSQCGFVIIYAKNIKSNRPEFNRVCSSFVASRKQITVGICDDFTQKVKKVTDRNLVVFVVVL